MGFWGRRRAAKAERDRHCPVCQALLVRDDVQTHTGSHLGVTVTWHPFPRRVCPQGHVQRTLYTGYGSDLFEAIWQVLPTDVEHPTCTHKAWGPASAETLDIDLPACGAALTVEGPIRRCSVCGATAMTIDDWNGFNEALSYPDGFDDY